MIDTEKSACSQESNHSRCSRRMSQREPRLWFHDLPAKNCASRRQEAQSAAEFSKTNGRKNTTEGSNVSLPASESIESVTYRESSQYSYVSGQTRGYLPLKGTGERSLRRIASKKFGNFSVREVARPLSGLSEIKLSTSKSDLCTSTKSHGREFEAAR